MKKSSAPPRSPADQVGLRLDPRARREQILKAAIAYFAEVGFSGQTRELSRRIGVSQALIYRYFPSKADLIDEVFESVFIKKWNPDWIMGLRDRKVPLRDRLVHFYMQYSTVTYNSEWLRIYMFAGLAGMGWNRNYLDFVRRKLLTVICGEVRHSVVGMRSGLPSRAISPREIEMVWNLHGSMFHWAVRCNIFNNESTVPFKVRAEDAVDLFLAGSAEVYSRMWRKSSKGKPPR